MDILERIWEGICLFFSSIMGGFERGITSVFGSSNARYVKRLNSRIEAINALESKYEGMSEEELRHQTELFRNRLIGGESLDDILVEAFAVCREGGKRFLGMRHYDVQLMGGMVLHSGAIAEMVTGEGKTLVATLPAYLNAIEGLGVHVITVNDYLARRDMEWMGPLYAGLGLTVGAIQNDMEVSARQAAYACDITYGTNNEFGFDYLRDNMRPAARGDDNFDKHYQQAQGRLNYAIIDEVDNILIDEARTPLIISGPAHDDVRKYAEADRVARQLKVNVHFEVSEKDRSAHLTDEGVRAAEKIAGVESFYTAGNMGWPHLIDNALKAHHIQKRDVNYVVKEGRVVIVDEFTGRLMEGRQWSDGLHQAVEAKEGVKIKEESQTLATITLQNFFKLYAKLSGMTGTAMTEAGEFWKIYGLDVIAIPTNRVLQRIESPDLIYVTESEKYEAIAQDIERTHKWDVLVSKDGTEEWGKITSQNDDSIVFQPKASKDKVPTKRSSYVEILRRGRPILVGTTSIEKSEVLSDLLAKRGIKHEVLNAKFHKREAEIVAQAGRKSAVTIATNMAGRGTDIVLGGNPETMAWAILQDKYPTRLDVPREEWDSLVAEIDEREKMSEMGQEVKQLGGLHVIGTERHEARRIDLQLRGRCGRQGDPGSSRFYLSLHDDLMRIFAGPWVEKVFKTMGMQEGEAIESKMVSRRIESAQKKVEERNFESRKSLLEYDEVMDEQRRRIYSYRQAILDGTNVKDLIITMINDEANEHVRAFMQPEYGRETFCSWAGNKLSSSLEPRDYRGCDFEQARQLAISDAERMAESQVLDAIDENLPNSEDVDDAEWNWNALAKFANSRWGLSLRDRDLKKIGRGNVDEFLIERAHQALNNVDLSEGEIFLDADFGLRTTVGWARQKFGVDLALDDIRDLDANAIIDLVRERAIEAYEQREADYPIMAGMYRFSTQAQGGHSKLDRAALVAWASERFDAEIDLESIKSKQREEIRDILVEYSRRHQKKADEALVEAEAQVDKLFGTIGRDVPVAEAGLTKESLQAFCDWFKDRYVLRLTPDTMRRLTRQDIANRANNAVERRYRPEMRRMERSLVLQLVDTSWKDHLLAMDHLRSAVNFVGYAQVDPKVEYKREGMRLFDDMWVSLGQRVTDLIFRMEQLDEGFVGSTFVETAATHEKAPSTSDIAQQQEAAIESSQQQGDSKSDPIRNRDKKVGRNEPCPCGSGKKYKNCCMRSAVGRAT